MTTTKQEFIRSFLPESVKDISFAQIDLDITDLSLGDILRNVNRTFPQNTRNRNAMKSGQFAVGILCKTELLYPISGLLLIITSEDVDIEIISKNYIVIAVPEDRIVKDEFIASVLDSITRYIILNFRDCIGNLAEFYAKFVYDPSEEDEDFFLQNEKDIIDVLYKRIRHLK